VQFFESRNSDSRKAVDEFFSGLDLKKTIDFRVTVGPTYNFAEVVTLHVNTSCSGSVNFNEYLQSSVVHLYHRDNVTVVF
jgi:hypothetical protein